MQISNSNGVGRAHRVVLAAVAVLLLTFGGDRVLAQAADTSGGSAKVAAKRDVIPTPKPGAPDEEAAHNKRYDAAIAPIRDHPVAAEDAEALRTAFARVAANDDAAARAARDKIKDPVARKLVEWFRLRSGIGTVDEYRSFLNANPRWPNRALLTRRLEEALFVGNASADEINAVFKDATFKSVGPTSAAGHAALATAYLAAGDKPAATRQAAIAWRDNDFSASHEQVFISRLGPLLSAKDHKWRLDRLLIDDLRWRAERNARAAVARRMLKYLDAGERKTAEARIAALLRSRSASGLLAKAGSEKVKPADRDWGLEFHVIQDLRRRGKANEAAQRLLKVPLADAGLIVAPDEWWNERRAIAYALLKADKPKLAYDVVKVAGALSVNPLKNQAFHAGWLALRYVGNAKLAEQHFAAMHKAADGPLTTAKAAYWRARAAEAQGGEGIVRAKQYYEDAARFADTFHGQLARAKLGKAAATLDVSMPAAPSVADIAAFRALDVPRAAVIAKGAGLPGYIVRTMLARMQLNQDSEVGIALVAHVARALGDTQMSVRIGKAGIARGHNLIVYSYPLHAFPAFTPLREPPEMALLLAVARQESEFNTDTKSGAGARGILQVMPITARHVCSDYRIKCDIGRLMTDESYNAMLASAYIADRMAEFRGSYVLGIAGYNAGPGRARQWVRQFGDPRDPKVDVIDWIHRIPFEETRAYVQKVLSNLQVYRARLASGPIKIGVMQDLARARNSLASAN